MRFNFILFFLLLSLNVFSAEKNIEVMVKKTELTSSDPAVVINVLDLFTVNGIRQAITQELLEKGLDSEAFWHKVDEKKLTETQEIEFFKPLFVSQNLMIKDNEATEATKVEADLFKRANFTYEVNTAVAKKLFDEVLTNLPDVTLKTFYILPEISIDSEMTWPDVGVSKKENFSGVIVESWKKWAANSFKNFVNVVVLEQDLTSKPETMNPESVILKWNSNIKRTEVYQDRKSARFIITAQYVINNAKSGQSLVAFDFPAQKREMGISNSKELSSGLASLIYNLLNSQTTKINGVAELNKVSGSLFMIEMKVVGKHGLFDISQLNSFLAGHFKDQVVSSELKSYASESSVISIKSSLAADSLYALFAKDGGKFPINEQKILLFNPQDKTFAIIPKEANN